MRTEYLPHFCTRCMRELDHVKLTYIDHITMTCMNCQKSCVVEEEKVFVEKSYKIISIDEKDFNKLSRREVVVEVQRTTSPDKMGESGINVETLMVKYPAYGSEHYAASVAIYPGGGPINFKEAEEIAKEIKKCLK